MRDDAVKGMHQGMPVDLNGGVGADKGVDIKLIARRRRPDPVFEQVIQMIGAVKAQQIRNIGAERGCQTAKARDLLR